MPIVAVLRISDPTLTELVDAEVGAVDTDRLAEVGRLREALEPFGAASLFDAEFRQNGIASADASICVCEGLL